MENIFKKNIEEHLEVITRIYSLTDDVLNAIEICTVTLRGGGKIMLCGNGGSAADSQHLAAEFTGRFIKDRKPLAAMALTTDSSALTCIGNDYSFADVFARQVIGLGNKGDCVIGISTSGNSENVIKAIKAANKIGMRAIGLLGRDGGELASLCECSVIVPSNITARIQEAHILIGHTICGAVEHNLGLFPLTESL